MGKYDRLLEQHQDIVSEADVQFSLALQGMHEMATDASRTADLYRNAEQALSEIDEQFMAATKLNRTDVAFLMLATALQVSRWIVIGKVNQSVSKTIQDSRMEHNDSHILDMEKRERDSYRKSHGSENVEGKHRDWVNIIYNGVPYDITRGCGNFGVSMEGGLHRIHTLGHDPILGWIFGTMNILSDTITLEDFRTFSVCMEHGRKHWVSVSSLSYAFLDAVDSIKEDPNRLPAAVFAQALHLKSDVFTKQGLPIPLVESFAPEVANKVYKAGYDSLLLVKDVAVVGVQAVSSILINMLIAALHGLFYDPALYPNSDLYEVKTRKILSISNAIASTSNIIWVGGNAWMGNEEAWKDLDIGGILVTVYRLVTDAKFIAEVKKEYLASAWQDKVLGEDYTFLTEETGVSKKDVKKGIAIQAEADAAKQDKVAKGLKQQATILRNIEAGQEEVQSVVSVVLQDKAIEEAKSLYGIEITKSPLELGQIEKHALCSALYTLMDQYGQNSDYQRAFYLNLEKYLGVSKRASGFDFENLNNIDSHSDRKVILKVICAFLSLGDPSFAFADDTERFGWLSAFTSKKDVKTTCEDIRKEFSVLGKDGIVNRYRAIEASRVPQQSLIEEQEAQHPVTDKEENKTSTDYSGLQQIIGSYIKDEMSFGKQLDSFPPSLTKELKKAFPQLNFGTFLFGSKVGNGYLLFSTAALYLRRGTSLKGEYVRIPYKSIDGESLATAAGRVAGTRKLLLSFDDANGERKVLTIDDSIIKEERLQELLKEVVSSGCQTASTDFNVDLPNLDYEAKTLYVKALGNILARDNRVLTELLLIIQDYGLEDHWNEIAMAFTDDASLTKTVQDFIDRIPYPSSNLISRQAVFLALQTLFRTNRLEKKEVSMLSAEAETLVRLFVISEMDDKEFNGLIKLAADSKRTLDLQTCFELKERLPEETLYKEQIQNGLAVHIAELEQTIKGRRSFGDTIRDATHSIPESAERIKDSAGRFIEGFRDGFKSNSKKENLILPSNYQKLKKKFPEGVGIPKEAVGYGMKTGAASVLLISYPVTEEQTMPFDNPQWVIDQQHNSMGDNEGLIEVKNGETKKGRPYIYEIIKHRMSSEDGIPLGVEYTLNINVKMENSIQFINGSFSEAGMTGVRDSTIYAVYQNAMAQKDQSVRKWTEDPYDPEYQKGFLMNLSEQEELDEKFPSHPLSEARRFVNFIIGNN